MYFSNQRKGEHKYLSSYTLTGSKMFKTSICVPSPLRFTSQITIEISQSSSTFSSSLTPNYTADSMSHLLRKILVGKRPVFKTNK